MDDPTSPILSLTQQGMDTVTGLALNPAGTHLLSNSMDSLLRAWDIRPFFEGTGSEDERCERTFEGLRHGAEKVLLRCAWSPNGERVTCGSADRYDGSCLCIVPMCYVVLMHDVLVFSLLCCRIVHIWDYNSCKELYHLPGHKGSVNEVVFHPSEPIVASCGSDKQIFLGEL